MARVSENQPSLVSSQSGAERVSPWVYGGMATRWLAEEPIPKYRQYHRPIVYLPAFWSDPFMSSDSIGLRTTRNKGEES
jgi:hypothetical protein